MDKDTIPRRKAITESVSTMKTDVKERANSKDCAAVNNSREVWDT